MVGFLGLESYGIDHKLAKELELTIEELLGLNQNPWHDVLRS